ncbi:hypothetical protein KY321_04950 [Candidatus Woesearchaeota archaeon]|nr:hypothetical protein [Candidatus Woesearchaeota archaeon]
MVYDAIADICKSISPNLDLLMMSMGFTLTGIGLISAQVYVSMKTMNSEFADKYSKEYSAKLKKLNKELSNLRKIENPSELEHRVNLVLSESEIPGLDRPFLEDDFLKRYDLTLRKINKLNKPKSDTSPSNNYVIQDSHAAPKPVDDYSLF